MNRFFLVVIVMLSACALFAQSGVLATGSDAEIPAEILELIATSNAQTRDFSFNFVASPYNLPDSTDIADPETGLFLEDTAWIKDFTRHIDNPENVALTLSFYFDPVHFTVTQPDPGNPLKLQFEPINANWNGGEILFLVATEPISGDFVIGNIRLNVTPVPDPPVWSGLPDGNNFFTNEETALQIDFQDYISCIDSADPTNFDLNVLFAEYPIDVSQEPAGTGSLVTFAPQQDYNGIASYELTAVDRLSNAYSSQTIYINVLNINDPPEIVDWQPEELTQNIDQGDTLSFAVTAEDVENDDLSYTWTHSGSQDGVPFSEVVSTTASLELQFSIPGTQTLSCEVSDAEATDSIIWTVNVSPSGPLFDPAGGTYTSGISVTLAPPAGFEGAVIHYTTDGTPPTETSPVYSAPIAVDALGDVENNVTIQAFFTYPDFPPSQVTSQSYRITGTVADPVFNPLGGLYYAPLEVTLNSSDPAATIYYTLDGGDPVPGSPGTEEYVLPITVAAETTLMIKALAAREGWLDSAIVSQTYQVTGTVQIVSHSMTPPPLPDGEFYLIDQGESLAVEITGLMVAPASATVYYTLDNSLPGPDNPNAQVYNSGQQIQLTNPTWITFKAYLSDWQASETFSYYYDVRTKTVFLPYANGTVFDPAPGYSTTPVSVSISASTLPAGASIYYTLDGSDPDAATGLLYTSPIPVSETTTVKALAQYPGLYPSDIHEGLFTITGTVEAPVFDPLPGSFSAPIQLAMSTGTANAAIYYSLDGSEPSPLTRASFLYEGPVSLANGLHQVKARAFKENWDPSSITEGIYSIGILPAPEFDLAAGLYFDPIVVRLSLTSAPEASIHYTTDGSEPTEASTLYDPVAGIPIGLETSYTIKAIAVQAGWINSDVAERSYQVTGTVGLPAFDPDGGTHDVSVTVSISSATADAVIRYTLDGQDPSLEYGSTYDGPILINSSATLKARAYRTDWRPSEIHGAIYTIIGNIANPVFTPGPGTYTSPVDVYISVNPPDATIYYTSDSSEPSQTNGTIYVAGTPVNIAADTLLRAKAYKTGWNASGVTDAQYYITGTVSAPVFDPPSGQYAEAQMVALSATPAAATIVYTLDGSTPTQDNGSVYNSPIEISANTIVKAFAWLDGWNDSSVSTASYVINGPVALPIISPTAGYYNTLQTISISVIPAAATIRYTLDGSEPSLDNGITYTAPFALEGNTTVKAYAYLDNWLDSAVATAEYFFVVSNPAISPAGGSYASAQTITMSVGTAGASIRYTLDGSQPTPQYGDLYLAPFQLTTTATVKAIAYRGNWISSNVISQSYVINGPVSDPLFSVPGGDYLSPFSVAITTLPAGSTIYYTTDGSDPSELNGTIYSTPVQINQNTTLKARAYRANWEPSNISAAVYNFYVSPVSIVPNGGTFTENQYVNLSTVTPGALISYTLDGSDPIPGTSPAFDPLDPVLVDQDLLLKAIASKENWYPSAIASADFDINIPLPDVATPVILPPSGVYNAAQTVTMSTTTPDATLVFTTDGSEPSLENGTVYAGGFVVDSNVTIKARGFKDGYDPSLIATVQYVIVIPIETVQTPVFDPPAGIYNEAIQVTISTQTPEATIRYTIDGTEPSETVGTIYSGPVNISETTTIKAIAYKTGMNTSLISNASYLIDIIVPEVAAPMFSYPSGTYYQPIQVEISTTTENALIHYTTDGTVPSPTNGTLYMAPINIPSDSNLFIQAMAYRDGWNPSPVVSASYTVTGTVADVSFSPVGGIYTQATPVVLTTSTPGATIRYTTDSSEPDEDSTLYTTAIVVPLNSTMTINAKGFKPGWQPSTTTHETYIVTGQVIITPPIFSLAAGVYTTAQTVSINDPIPADATIRYTTDGSDPQTTSEVYTGPIDLPLNATITLKARAFRENWIASPLYSATYVMTGQVTLPDVLFDPAAGTYQTAQSITLNPPLLPTEATLRYTLDGSEPSQFSPAYTAPIQLGLNSTTTIKVKGFRDNWLPSATVSATYLITGQVAFQTPVFSPAPGVYTTAQQITVNGTTPADAVVRYTIDGTDPTELSPQYSAPIDLPLETSLTLKVRAFKPNWAPSEIQTGNYTTTGAVTITLPVFNPSPGLYTSPQSVAINTTTIPAGATLRYTLDGSDPNQSSPVYSTPIQVSNGQSITIRVRAYAANWQPSEIHTGVYTVTGQVTIAEPVFTPPAGTYQTAQVVTLNTLTTPAGATLRYTLDGSEPTATSPVYSTAIQLALGSLTTIKVKAYLTNWLPSQTYSATYNITGALSIVEPVFTPASGTYQTAQSVVINTSTSPAGGTVRYTTDGSDPTATSPIYSTPVIIPLNTTLTVKAVAFLAGWTPSQVYSATYTVTGQVQLPAQVFSPPAGTYQTAQSITLNTSTTPAGATLRYTLDGSVPTENSPAYTAPINLPLNSSTTISVKAFKANWTPSATVTATYVITGQIVFQTPVFTPPEGIYQTSQIISVSETIPADATIRYTTDGSEPTAASSVYTTPISLPLNSNTTIKVKAFKTDWTASATHTATYTITGQASIAAPVFDPAPGTYPGAQSISINASTVPAGSQIRYTLDGSEPLADSPLYTSPIPMQLNNSYELRARAFATNWTPSPVYVGYYTITGTVTIPAPVFTPAAGTYTTDIAVVLNTQTAPAGATLHYSLDGNEPNESYPAYTQPIQLFAPADVTVKVKAYRTGWTPSQTYTAEYVLTGQMQLLPPYLSPAPGVYTEPISVSSVGGTDPTGGTIRYTTDGSTPTEASPVFAAPVSIGLNSIDFTITIRAFKDGWIPSQPWAGVYSVTGQVQLEEDLFSPTPGTYQSAQNVTLAVPVLPANATVRYTTDGSEPTVYSAAYTAPITLPQNATTTVKAKGFAEGWIPSETQAAVYTITGTVSPPVFSPPGGTFGAPVFVVISSPTEGAEIRYTIDGTDPTPESGLYSEPIVVPNFAQDMVISARAYKPDWTPSPVASATYTIFSAPVDVRGFTYAGYIRVLWNLPGAAKGLDGFNVYRRKLADAEYAQINTSLVNTQVDGNYYYDDYSIEMDVSYEYYVTAVYDGAESPASASTVEYYQSGDLDISDASYAWPNPATDQTEFVVILNRNNNVTLTVTIYDFAGKKVQTIPSETQNSNQIRIPWDLKNTAGAKVGRGTYFARVVANDGVNRSERVIKIAVK
ncbi:MAG: chitobiase/beta-hexosaminidase C-terminal domain-containing protein [Candidatus Cloacimonetes bacterium]|nr:chitobiase/beta-hexosaminidase C-terminal domain-containing protein [Candidatus Cloacimonadota bacterium]